jgi:hypothetical protein
MKDHCRICGEFSLLVNIAPRGLMCITCAEKVRPTSSPLPEEANSFLMLGALAPGQWRDIPPEALDGTGILSMSVTCDDSGWWGDIEGEYDAGWQPFGAVGDPIPAVEDRIIAFLAEMRLTPAD